MIAELREMGVNFLMIHCYKGAGLRTEEDGMEDARKLAALAHKAGITDAEIAAALATPEARV